MSRLKIKSIKYNFFFSGLFVEIVSFIIPNRARVVVQIVELNHKIVFNSFLFHFFESFDASGSLRALVKVNYDVFAAIQMLVDACFGVCSGTMSFKIVSAGYYLNDTV